MDYLYIINSNIMETELLNTIKEFKEYLASLDTTTQTDSEILLLLKIETKFEELTKDFIKK